MIKRHCQHFALYFCQYALGEIKYSDYFKRFVDSKYSQIVPYAAVEYVGRQIDKVSDDGIKKINQMGQNLKEDYREYYKCPDCKNEVFVLKYAPY